MGDVSKRSKLKVAFLGGGLNSAVGRAHKVAIEMDGCFELVAGCFSRHADKNKDTGDYYGVDPSRVYACMDSLLANEKNEIDAVVILTPTPAHFEEVCKCIDIGLPIICEKSLAASSNQTRKLWEKVDEAKAFLAVTYNYTGYPMIRELQSRVQRGDFGRIEQIHVEMPQEGFARLDEKGNPQKPQEWRLHDGALPTLYLDLGVHIHHLIEFITGEKPIEVIGLQSQFGSFREVVDNALCLARYTGDVVGNIWMSKSSIGFRNGLRIRVYGDQASAEWYQLEPETLLIADNQGNRQIIDRATPSQLESTQWRYARFKAGHPAGYIEAFANHYTDIAEALHCYLADQANENPYVFGVEAAHEGLAMLEAMCESSGSTQWTKVRSESK